MELQQKVEGRDAGVRWWWRTASARSEGREAAARERKEEAAVGSRRRTPVRSRCAWSWRKWRDGRGDGEVRRVVAAAEGEGAERRRRARESCGASAMARREGGSDGLTEYLNGSSRKYFVMFRPGFLFLCWGRQWRAQYFFDEF
jgi:hypothetical protein